MNTSDYIRISEDRKKANNVPYNPLTGAGCEGERFLVSLPDCPQGDVFLPVEMKERKEIMDILNAESLQHAIANLNQENEDVLPTISETWHLICLYRIKFDFEYIAAACETIRDKLTGANIPFYLNNGQRIVLARLEKMRRKNIPIRIIILKSRQWGCTTLIQMYILWITTVIKFNWNSVICTHVKDASRHVNNMFLECIRQMPPINNKTLSLVPFARTLNTLHIPQRGNRITIGTAQEPESIRTQDVKIAHFSEIPYWPATDNNNPTKIIGSTVASIPFVPYSIIVYESTANGVGGFFYNLCLEASKSVANEEFIFIAWHETGEIATINFDNNYINHAGKIVNGSINDFVLSLNDYEKYLFKAFPHITLEHIHFYRSKKAELKDLIFQEFPSTYIEAFKNKGYNVFKEEHILPFRDDCNILPIDCGYLQGEANAQGAITNAHSHRSILKNIRFIRDKQAFEITQAPRSGIGMKERERQLNNKLIIWQFPDTTQFVSNRYIVVYDPAKGTSDGADWGSIVVLDRYWRMFNGVTEVVAQWKGHEDLYITIWIAAQIAKFYSNALLVVECNTFDSLKGGRNETTEFIFETIKQYYFNLYARTDPQKVKEGQPVKYGFFTGRNKANLVEHFKGILAQKGYIERSDDTLDQALVYELNNGKYGAKHGYHDDDLITRMIGLYIDHKELSFPKIIQSNDSNKAQPDDFSDTQF
jgi:hypothetical protein